MQLIRLSLVVTVLLLLQSCSLPEGAQIHDCVDGKLMRVVCGMQSPEDIAVIPGGDYLLLSELGEMGDRAGRILLFNTNDESWRPIYSPAEQKAPTQLQGDESCDTPPTEQMSPHGTHLTTLSDGTLRYLLVNHGDREAVELFSVENDSDSQPSLRWQGCIFPAANTLMNDVVGMTNGDVIYTRMFKPDDFASELRAMLFKSQSGDVWRWNKESGVRLLPGTQGSLTNGIEISPDQRFVFINQYMNQEVHKYDLQKEKVAGVAAIPNADNSAWAPNGDLWLATHSADIRTLLACFQEPLVTCGLEFDIVALNPETMAARSVFKHQGPPMGAATVARFSGDKVYLGSFLGDRLAIVPLAEFQ